MLMKIILALICYLVFFGSSFSQGIANCNVILNSGFEDYIACPDTFGHIDSARYWYNGAYGSSDYYNLVCGLGSLGGGVLSPPQPYPSPNGVIGMYLSDPTAFGAGYYKEDLGQMIDVCQGQKYEFEIMYAPNAGFGYPILNNAAIYLGNSAGLPVPYDPVTLCPTGFQQAITIPTTGAPLGWTAYTATFVATQNTNTLILGADCSAGPITTGRSYMYFDDLILRPIDTLSLSASTLTVCAGEVFNINISIPGGCYGPYDVVFTRNGVYDTLKGISANHIFKDSVTVNTLYQFEEIINGLNCSSPLNIPFGATISATPTTTMLAYDFCINDSNLIVINGNANGAYSFTINPGSGETIDPVTGLITGAIVNTSYYITYLIGGACPDTLYDSIQALPCDDTCELITNGDFEIGNAGFTSPDQVFTTTNCFNDGFYSITNSVATCFGGQWILGNDHTTGNGNFLAVNLNNNIGTVPQPYAYCTDIQTVPGKDYSYCLWASNFHFSNNTPTIAFELDGNLMGGNFIVPPGGGWYQHGGIFTATTTNSQLCIRQVVNHNGLPGIDLALDDISVKQVADSVVISVDKDSVPCSGDFVNLNIKVYGCPIEYAFEVNIDGNDTVLHVLDSITYSFFVNVNSVVSVTSANCQNFWDTVINILGVTDTANFTLQDFCIGAVQNLTMAGTPGGTFSFDPDPFDGSSINPITGLISNEVSGATYQVKYVTPTRCDSLILPVNIMAVDTAIISGGGNVCDGTPVTITVNFTGTGPWNLVYTNGNTVDTVTNIIANPYVFTTLDSGTYVITELTSVDCDGIFSGQALVTKVSNDTAILSGGGDVCDGTPIAIRVDFVGTPPWSITYTDGINQATVNNINVTPYTFNVLEIGTYALVSFSNANCDGYFTGQANVTGDSLDFTADLLAGCSPLQVNFNDLVNVSNGGVCSWDFGNGLTSNNCTGISSIYDNPGCYDVTLSISAANCSTSTTIPDMICVYDNPVSVFGISPEIITTLQNTANFINTSYGATNYEWFVNGVRMSTSVNFVHVFGDDTNTNQVCLVAFNSYGCSDTICQNIRVEEEVSLFVPNSFTPDGDGINDFFTPVATGLDSYELLIFDRWGELIFESENIENYWDGKYKGLDSKTDVYVWKIVYTAPSVKGKKTIHGHVSLLR